MLQSLHEKGLIDKETYIRNHMNSMCAAPDPRAEAIKAKDLLLKHKGALTVDELRDLIEKLRVEIL